MQLGTERPMIPQQIDPPAQTRYRKLLDPHFSRRKMEELAPAVARHARELIDGFVARRRVRVRRRLRDPAALHARSCTCSACRSPISASSSS